MTYFNTGNKISGGATRLIALLGTTALLLGCEEGKEFNLFKPKEKASDAQPVESAAPTLVERDVEAPDVFKVSEAGLWDGRPSLGGVWVAHSDVKDPERVLIVNTVNNKSVIGALFRRERENPGPRLQVSSDAADALGMLAGAPAKLNVVALRREEVPQPAAAAESTAALNSPATVTETELDPIASAAAAIGKAETAKTATAAAAGAAAPVATAPLAKPEPTSKPMTSGLDKPFIQLGIFSVETNANNTATAMRSAGMVPTVKKQSSSGKTFWRVLVGPASNSSERATLLKKIKASGFTDAYAVSN